MLELASKAKYSHLQDGGIAGRYGASDARETSETEITARQQLSPQHAGKRGGGATLGLSEGGAFGCPIP